MKASAGHRGRHMRSGKVLILEANEQLRSSWTQALSREGYSVTAASSVKEAVESAGQQPYDLLVIHAEEPELLDMLLPQFPSDAGTLIIMTPEVVSRVVERLGTGIYSFLIQPFSLSRLRKAVAQTMDRTRSVAESLRSRILTTLEQASRLLTSEVEPDQFFKLIVEMSATGTKADYVSLATRDEVTGKFVINAEQGKPRPAWKSICQEMMEIGEPILLDETTQNHSHLHRLMTETGISAVLCIPLSIKGNVIGAMNHIKVADRGQFGSSDLNFASILAWWASTAIENTSLLGRVQEQRLHVEELLDEISRAQENERRRVAIQIHDGVAQWMVGATYSINACSSLISESRMAELETELLSLGKTLQRSVKELRRAIANLRPIPLEEVGLVDALRHAAEELAEEGISCHTEVDGQCPKLSFAEETTTYWIVQEILTNIRNHSGASDVYLRIQFGDTAVSVEVTDNGQGFNPDEVLSSAVPLEHMGLVGMQERARLLGGSLIINSNPGQGTSIGFTFSVSPRLAMKTTA